MSVQGALPVGGGDAVQSVAHVGADIVVEVLVEGEGAAGVLDEEVEHADLVVAELGEFGEDVVGDQVGAAGARGEGEGLLEPGHVGGRDRDWRVRVQQDQKREVEEDKRREEKRWHVGGGRHRRDDSCA